MKKILPLLLLLCYAVKSSGQGYANNWYFGNGAGISFVTTPPKVLEDGRLSTLEGCSTISDERGNLLFYTDGTTVYNKEHRVMSNGTELYGDPSSTQSAIIIPKPLDDRIFYIFTVDARVGDDVGYEGLNYSIVDFTSNSEGEVTEKNVKLLNYSSEKLSAVIKGCDSDTVWVVTFSSTDGDEGDLNTFYAWEVTSSGLMGRPVKSSFGINIGEERRGNLKFSPDGKKVASANAGSGLYLFDFDSQTGRFSNPTRLEQDLINFASYGVEFSPNNRFLYTTTYNDADIFQSPEENTTTLTQYDLDAADLEAGKVVIDDRKGYRGTLQLGPNGRIYKSMSTSYFEGQPYLSVIENPDLKAPACNYVHNAISLQGANSHQGLPPFNQSLFNTIDIINNGESTSLLNLCEDERYTLSFENLDNAVYKWYKNGELIAGANSNTLDIKPDANLNFPYEVVYELRLDPKNGTCEKIGRAYVGFYTYPQRVIDVELVQCEDSTKPTGLSIFNLNKAIPELTQGDDTLEVTFFSREDQASSPESAPLEPVGYKNSQPVETLYAKLTTPAGCFAVMPFQVHVSSTQARSATITICDENLNGLGNFDLNLAKEKLLEGRSNNVAVTFYSSENGALLELDRNRLQQIHTNRIPYAETVYARLQNNSGCFAIGQVNLEVLVRPKFELEDSYYCTNTFPQVLTIVPQFELDDSKNYSYQWMPEGLNTPNLTTNQTGVHTLTITDLTTGCSTSKSLTIEERGLASFENIEVTDLSSNNSILVEYSGNGEYVLALDDPEGPYQEGNFFENVNAGFHTVFIKSLEGCGTVSKEVSIIGFDKFFTPNGDGVNDYWQINGANELVQPQTDIFIFDRFGKLLNKISPIGLGWDGTVGGVPLPPTDYWFRAQLQDGRTVKGHFSLKR
ncbi:MAG: T9SS type B sorting domain-containing protein [Leeuwenhoekiella sp.]